MAQRQRQSHAEVCDHGEATIVSLAAAPYTTVPPHSALATVLPPSISAHSSPPTAAVHDATTSDALPPAPTSHTAIERTTRPDVVTPPPPPTPAVAAVETPFGLYSQRHFHGDGPPLVISPSGGHQGGRAGTTYYAPTPTDTPPLSIFNAETSPTSPFVLNCSQTSGLGGMAMVYGRGHPQYAMRFQQHDAEHTHHGGPHLPPPIHGGGRATTLASSGTTTGSDATARWGLYQQLGTDRGGSTATLLQLTTPDPSMLELASSIGPLAAGSLAGRMLTPHSTPRAAASSHPNNQAAAPLRLAPTDGVARSPRAAQTSSRAVDGMITPPPPSPPPSHATAAARHTSAVHPNPPAPPFLVEFLDPTALAEPSFASFDAAAATPAQQQQPHNDSIIELVGQFATTTPLSMRSATSASAAAINTPGAKEGAPHHRRRVEAAPIATFGMDAEGQFRTVAGWMLVRRIGEGQQAEVWEAFDEATCTQRRAVKLCRSHSYYAATAAVPPPLLPPSLAAPLSQSPYCISFAGGHQATTPNSLTISGVFEEGPTANDNTRGRRTTTLNDSLATLSALRRGGPENANSVTRATAVTTTSNTGGGNGVGEGGFMYRSMSRSSNDPVVQLHYEIGLHRSLDHPHIVKLYDVVDVMEDGDSMATTCLIMQLASNGPIARLGRRKTCVPRSLRLLTRIARQAASALDYLHNARGAVHRDIKPDNMLLDEDNNLLLADFGVSAHAGRRDGDAPDGGAMAFRAPEEFGAVGYPTTLTELAAVDMWSLGVSLALLTTGEHPFEYRTYAQLRHAVLTSEPTFRQPSAQPRPVVATVQQRPVQPPQRDDFNATPPSSSAFEPTTSSSPPADVLSSPPPPPTAPAAAAAAMHQHLHWVDMVLRPLLAKDPRDRMTAQQLHALMSREFFFP